MPTSPTPTRTSAQRRALVVGGPVGGLALWPNGIRSLRALGLGDAVQRIAARVPEMAIRRPDGRLLGRFDGDAIERRWGAPLLAVHRADLLAAELAHLGAARVRHCTEVELVEEGGVRLTDGTVLEADLVVGADGLGSGTPHGVVCDGPPAAPGHLPVPR